jgi:hypothetical protein
LDGIVAAAQHAADAGQQLARLERFRQVIVGAHFQAQDAVQRLVAGSQHDHRQRGRGAQLAAQAQAVVAGQVQVQHDQVRARLVELFPHGAAVRRALRAVAIGLQVIGQQRADIAVVVDDQDGRSLFHASIILSSEGEGQQGFVSACISASSAAPAKQFDTKAAAGAMQRQHRAAKMCSMCSAPSVQALSSH